MVKIFPHGSVWELMDLTNPVVVWDGIYWGAQGGKSYGASIRLRVIEMAFTPGVLKSYVPSRRMLDAVKKKKEEESSDEKEEYEDEIVFEDG